MYMILTNDFADKFSWSVGQGFGPLSLFFSLLWNWHIFHPTSPHDELPLH